jgi:hypothetical protein
MTVARGVTAGDARRHNAPVWSGTIRFSVISLLSAPQPGHRRPIAAHRVRPAEPRDRWNSRGFGGVPVRAVSPPDTSPPWRDHARAGRSRPDRRHPRRHPDVRRSRPAADARELPGDLRRPPPASRRQWSTNAHASPDRGVRLTACIKCKSRQRLVTLRLRPPHPSSPAADPFPPPSPAAAPEPSGCGDAPRRRRSPSGRGIRSRRWKVWACG